MQPTASIIVPCYNHAEYLAETLNTVLAQTTTRWECIIVNDGSTDDTEKVAKEYLAKDTRFKYYSQQNAGLSAARNTGIKIATGEYILPLDADDLIGKDYIEKALNAYQNNVNLSLVYCQANRFGNENFFWNLVPYSYQNLLINNCIFCSAVFRKTAWQEIGGYNVNFMAGLEDWEFWTRLLNAESEVYQIPEILFYYRTKQKSMTTLMNDSVIEDYKDLIYENKIKDYRKYFGSYIKILHENFLLKDQVKRISESRSYKLGNKLLRPLSFIKHLLNRKK